MELSYDSLYCTILCPQTISVGKRYGTCEKIFLVDESVEASNHFYLLTSILPKIINQAIIKNNKFLIVLGNIKGVMDVFTRRNNNDSPQSQWLHFNNTIQTLQLIQYGLRKYQRITSSSKDLTKLIPICSNCYFISASDYVIDDTIKELLPIQISKLKTSYDIQGWFERNVDYETFGSKIRLSQIQLKKKCPALTTEEIIDQNLGVRYAHRRVVGVLIKAYAKLFRKKNYQILSPLKKEILDDFHASFRGDIISTIHLFDKFELKSKKTTLKFSHIIASLITLEGIIPIERRLIDKSYNLFKKKLIFSLIDDGKRSIIKPCIKQVFICNISNGVYLEDILLIKRNVIFKKSIIILLKRTDVFIISNSPILPFPKSSLENIFSQPYSDFLKRNFFEYHCYAIKNDFIIWEDLLSSNIDIECIRAYDLLLNSDSPIEKVIHTIKVATVLKRISFTKLIYKGYNSILSNYLGLASYDNHIVKRKLNCIPLSSNIDDDFYNLMHSCDKSLSELFNKKYVFFNLEKKIDLTLKLVGKLYGEKHAKIAKEKFKNKYLKKSSNEESSHIN